MKYKTKGTKVYLSRAKNYDVGKGRCTGDFQTSTEQAAFIKDGF